MIAVKRIVQLTAALGIAVTLGACAQPTSGTVVNASQAGVAQSVNFGTIVDARPVTVTGNTSGAADATATIAGGVIGGLIGNQIGGGFGNDVATVVGATAGAAAGNRAAQEVGTQQSVEWTVQLESGQTISVIQADPVFSVGQRVQVIQSGSGNTRLQAA